MKRKIIRNQNNLWQKFLVAVPTTLPGDPLQGRFTQLNQVLAFAINVVFGLGVGLAVIFIILGGIKWIVAGGDKMAAQNARQMVVDAIIGFIIVVGAFAIKYLVQNLLGAGTVGILPEF